MEKGKHIEISLPEALIQHIQCFLSGKEAARTTLLSKSWYRAWLTRPSLVFNQHDFKKPGQGSSGDKLMAFAMRTIRRYQGLNLKIESLRLQTHIRGRVEEIAHRLIVEALEMGATDLDLESLRPSPFPLPQEVFQSESLLRLSVKGCEIDGKVKCSMLKSLTLDNVVFKLRNMIGDLISCCNLIEELTISKSSRLMLTGKNLHELRKLKHLHLEMVGVEYSFFDDLDSRFPCLKDLSLVRCKYYRTSITIRISSTSLRRLSIVQRKVMKKGKFTAPNLARFSYSGMGIPSLSLEARECESHISLKTNRDQSLPWFLRLQKLLTALSPSKINLSINGISYIDVKGDFEVVREAVVVENVTIEEQRAPSSALLVRMFRICRPKFLSHFWLPMGDAHAYSQFKHSLKSLLETLMREVITPDCGVPDQNLFGRFGLKKVHMQVYEEINTEWHPILLQGPVDDLIDSPNKRKVRYELKW